MYVRQRVKSALIVAIVVASMARVGVAEASGQLVSRSVSMSNPIVSTSGVVYTVNFTPSVTTTIKSVDFLVCTSAFGACASGSPGTGQPTGFTWSATPTVTTTGNNVGTTGWTNSASTQNDARFSYGTNAATGNGAQSFAITSATNGSSGNTPYYVRITTYSDSALTTEIDSGSVVAVPTQSIVITGTVQETLTFCVYSGASCGTGTSVPLPSTGYLSAATNSTNTSKFDIATNAANGATVSYISSTFAGPSQTIPTVGAQAHTAVTPTAGTESFALSLTGVTGTLTATNGYAGYAIQTNGNYDQIATATATAGAVGTVTYAANIAAVTKPGVYNAVIWFQALATF